MAKTGLIVGGVVAGFIGFFALSISGTYNNAVNLDEKVGQSYSQVQVVMQRQADLIPNLVETVKGYTSHENETLAKISEARSGLTAAAKLDPREVANNPELQKQLIEAQAQASAAMVKLNAIKENYPELKAAPLFNNLMVEMTGSTNRVADARRKSQLTVEEFNKTVRHFPGNIILSAFGFSVKPYYKADEDAQKAPKISFEKKDK